MSACTIHPFLTFYLLSFLTFTLLAVVVVPSAWALIIPFVLCCTILPCLIVVDVVWYSRCICIAGCPFVFLLSFILSCILVTGLQKVTRPVSSLLFASVTLSVPTSLCLCNHTFSPPSSCPPNLA
ncbi:hypothetical protein V8F20_005767 [Naviculisporaceae sp. PSN 640]